MNYMSTIIFVGILFSFKNTVCVDEKYVNSALIEVYKIKSEDGSLKARLFINKLWPEISELFQIPVEIPKFRKELGKNDFVYVDKTHIFPNVGKITSFNFKKSDDKNVCIIGAEVNSPNPVRFEVYRQPSTSLVKAAEVSASFLFPVHGSIKLWIIVPNLLQPQAEITLKCVISIDSFTIESLNNPIVDESDIKNTDTKELVKLFRNNVKDKDIYTIIRIGIMKALFYTIKQDIAKPLVCLNKFFQDTLNELLRDYETKGIRLYSNNNDAFGSETTVLTKKGSSEINYETSIVSCDLKPFKLGIASAVTPLLNKPQGDVLMVDVMTIESEDLMIYQTCKTPASNKQVFPTFQWIQNFKFFTFAPLVFKYLRNIYGINEVCFLDEISHKPFTILINRVNSLYGNNLYMSQSKYYLAKNVLYFEMDVLQTVFLPAYLLNLFQNPDTLLPKFFGLYKNQKQVFGFNKETSLILMNNVMPTNIKIARKYDLKGISTKRRINHTYIDDDIMEHYPDGIYLQCNTYNRLMRTIKRDVKVLQGLAITDYSLLLGIHYENGLKEKINDSLEKKNLKPSDNKVYLNCQSSDDCEILKEHKTNNFRHGISAWTTEGEKLKLYVGIIDVLTRYTGEVKMYFKLLFWRYKFQNAMEPTIYLKTFNALLLKVFKKMIPCELGHSENEPNVFGKVKGK